MALWMSFFFLLASQLVDIFMNGLLLLYLYMAVLLFLSSKPGNFFPFILRRKRKIGNLISVLFPLSKTMKALKMKEREREKRQFYFDSRNGYRQFWTVRTRRLMVLHLHLMDRPIFFGYHISISLVFSRFCLLRQDPVRIFFRRKKSFYFYVVVVVGGFLLANRSRLCQFETFLSKAKRGLFEKIFSGLERGK